MGGDLIMAQRTLITGAVTIGDQCDNTALLHSTAHGNIDAILAHMACHNQMRHTTRFKLGCKIGLVKGITVGFVNHDISPYGGRFAANFPTLRPLRQAGTRCAVMLNNKNWRPGRTGLTLQHRNTVHRILKRLIYDQLTIHSHDAINDCILNIYNE